MGARTLAALVSLVASATPLAASASSPIPILAEFWPQTPTPTRFGIAAAIAGPQGAWDAARWASAALEVDASPTPASPPDAATQRILEGVADPAWRAWLLELDAARRSGAGSAAYGAAPVPLSEALARWNDVLGRVHALLPQMPPRPATATPLDECGVLRLDLVGADSESACTFLLEFDVGGNDTYRGNAGGSPPPVAGEGPAPPAPPALALDVAGRDVYECTAPEGGCTGGGQGGAGALFDLAGDDAYRGTVGVGGANGGGGRFGAGLLLDLSGNDSYAGFASRGGLNGGAGFGGAGLLVDAAGDDAYDGAVALFGGVNGGANDGVGVHVDLAGDDTRNGSVGVRGGVNAGGEQAVGLLFDGEGDDDYDGTVWGGGVNAAGTGNAFAALLVDRAGRDHYRGTIQSYGCVNGATHFLGSAALVDLGAEGDLYDATVEGAGAANGAGSGGTGALLDAGGNDTYRARILGSGAANGAAHFGAGVLVDGGGHDTYDAAVLEDPALPHPLWGPGGATNGGETTGVGLLVDSDGDAPPPASHGGLP